MTWLQIAFFLCGNIAFSLLTSAAIIDRNDLTPVGEEMPLPATFQHYPTPDKLGGFRSAVQDDNRRTLKLTDNSNTGEIGFSKAYSIQPGQYFRASVEVKCPDGTVDRNPPVFYLQLTFSPGGKSFQTRVFAPTGKYQTVEVRGQAPEKASRLQVFFYSQKLPQGEILVRNYQLESSDRPFADPPEIRTDRMVRLHAAAAVPNPVTTVLEEDKDFPGGVLTLKSGAAETARDMDLTFTIRAPRPGRYQLVSCTSLDPLGQELMRKAGSKFQSMMLELSLDGAIPTRRVAYSPWIHQPTFRSVLGKFDFNGEAQTLTVKLPAGLRLGYLEITPYTPPAVPDQVRQYQPKIVPPAAHPRLWVTPAELPRIRKRLTQTENRKVWEWLTRQARKPFPYQADPSREAAHNPALENAAIHKAFYYLMTGDESIGREAVALQKAYLPYVSFGNILDITREIGSAIYSAALVYDWCYPLLAEPDRELFHRHMMRLADDMEIGWPPFKQIIVNGHGNEAQVNRDLLSMAIALYERDPVPYQYCAYRLLEEVVPMRRIEYQSPRHNQGISYGAYRFGWELHAAWLLRRMTGYEIYPANVKTLGSYWLYARLPDSQMLRDGDGICEYNWNAPDTMLLLYSYAADPLLKGEFNRRSDWQSNALLYLLVNDPELPADPDLNQLPLARDSGSIIGSLIMRTGWTVSPINDDVVVEMRGGGIHFGGHMHGVGGAFQIFYRGIQAADLGQYHFYGTPYDYNFAKRSVSKNTLLIMDPAEDFRYGGNDGGQRFVLYSPANREEMLNRPENQVGKVLASTFGPSIRRPLYGLFNVDLAPAYSDKVKAYIRRFVFLNLGDPAHPAALLICDRVTTARPEFQKYWQINTLVKPVPTATGLRATNRATRRAGTMHVDMFLPRPEERQLTVTGGKPDVQVFGKNYRAPAPNSPEGRGYRAMFSPKQNHSDEVFATAITLADSGADKLPVDFVENGPALLFQVKEWTVAMPREHVDIAAGFDFAIPACGPAPRVLLTGLRPGDWTIVSADRTRQFRARVADHGGGVLLTTLPPGVWRAEPQSTPRAPVLPAVIAEAPQLPNPASRQVPDDDTLRLNYLLPQLTQLGIQADVDGNTLTLRRGRHIARLFHQQTQAELNGMKIKLSTPPVRQHEDWLLPRDFLCSFSGCDSFWNEQDQLILKRYECNSPLAAEVFLFDSKLANSQQEFRAMLLPAELRNGYFAANGRNAVFELVFFQPVELSGVGIKWLLGSARKAGFKLETSPDGRQYDTVFDGESSGTTEDFEDVTFSRRPVWRLRFTGRGNSDNAWNSIVSLRLLP